MAGLDPRRQHAAVFCVDEKSAVQALDRLDAVLPMSPGRASPHQRRVRRLSRRGCGDHQMGHRNSHRSRQFVSPQNQNGGRFSGSPSEGAVSPAYSPWLNQVIWFSKVERNVIARGVFTSVADLARKLRKYIRPYGKSQPFRWSSTDASRRIRPVVTI